MNDKETAGPRRLYRSPNLNGPIVNQAAGMVSVQAHCGIEEAFALMRARAAESRVSLDEIAQAVLDRAIDFLSGEVMEPNRDDVLSAAETLTQLSGARPDLPARGIEHRRRVAPRRTTAACRARPIAPRRCR